MAVLGALAPHAGSIIGGLASMLGGPKAEEAAKSIVDTATKQFGTSDPEVIRARAAADTALAQQAVAAMQEATKAYEVEVSDRKDARMRDLEIRRIPGSDGVPAGTNTRANVMLIGAFVSLLTVLTGTIYFRASLPDSIIGILQSTVGSLLTVITLAFNFEFGSSRGSSQKSDQIVDMAATAADVAKRAAEVRK